MAVATPGMTGCDPFDRKPSAFKDPVLFQCFHAVFRAGGRIPACRAQQRRDRVLINLYQTDEHIT